MITTGLIDLTCNACGDTFYVQVSNWTDGEPWFCPLCREVEE